jgi:hypothetical protein
VGLAYYRVQPAVLESLRPLIDAHEAEIVGPRARGYWFDYPDEYDYKGVRAIARQLDQAGQRNATERLEISEVQAQSLALLEAEVPPDGKVFPPALFMTSAAPGVLRAHLKLARKLLGSDPESAARRFAIGSADRRVVDYLKKQVRHLRETLPVVWHFHERAAEVEQAILVVDLRARDLDIPDAAELLWPLYKE